MVMAAVGPVAVAAVDTVAATVVATAEEAVAVDTVAAAVAAGDKILLHAISFFDTTIQKQQRRPDYSIWPFLFLAKMFARRFFKIFCAVQSRLYL
jgi:hypothetical protein